MENMQINNKTSQFNGAHKSQVRGFLMICGPERLRKCLKMSKIGDVTQVECQRNHHNKHQSDCCGSGGGVALRSCKRADPFC